MALFFERIGLTSEGTFVDVETVGLQNNPID
jgi:hypothetical protein